MVLPRLVPRYARAMKYVHTQLGSLHATIASASDDPPHLAVILCHGYGAPGDDFVSLADEITRRMSSDRARLLRFYFP